jgi:hypothetical protein
MIDTDTLKACVAGLEYPADVHDAVDQSEANGCPRSMVSQLQSSPNRTFSSPDELLCRLGDIDSCHLA